MSSHVAVFVVMMIKCVRKSVLNFLASSNLLIWSRNMSAIFIGASKKVQISKVLTRKILPRKNAGDEKILREPCQPNLNQLRLKNLLSLRVQLAARTTSSPILV